MHINNSTDDHARPTAYGPFLALAAETLVDRGVSAEQIARLDVSGSAELAAAVEAETARLASLMDGTHPVSPATAALACRLVAAAPDMEAARQILEAETASGPEPEAEL